MSIKALCICPDCGIDEEDCPANQYEQENNELKKQIDKMKNCDNCKFSEDTYANRTIVIHV